VRAKDFVLEKLLTKLEARLDFHRIMSHSFGKYYTNFFICCLFLGPVGVSENGNEEIKMEGLQTEHRTFSNINLLIKQILLH